MDASTFEHVDGYHQYFEGFKSPVAGGDPNGMATVDLKDPPRSDEKISDAFLAKQKELDELRNRAVEKDLELRTLESTLARKGEERDADIEVLKRDLGHERQAWMMTGND